jgi:predicted dehydrogenase
VIHRIGIGVIGTGFARRSYLPVFQSHPGSQVAAVCSHSWRHAEEAAAQYGIEKVYDDYRDLIADPAVEAVYVAVPHDLHLPVVSAAIEAGRHVLCEKPLGLNVEQAAALHALATAKGVTHMVGFLQRYLPVYRQMKQLVEEGRLGDVRHVAVHSMQGFAARPGQPFTWRDQVARTGAGGVLGDTGAHVIDLVLWLFDDIRRVCGFAQRYATAHPDAGSDELWVGDAPDAVSFVGELAGGGQCVVQVSFVASQCTWDVTMAASGAAGTLAAELHGTPPEGVRWHRLFGTAPGADGLQVIPLVGDPGAGATSAMEVARTDFQAAHRGVVDDFLRGIREGTSPSPSFRDGVRCQAVVSAVMQSAEGGRWAEVASIR